VLVAVSADTSEASSAVLLRIRGRFGEPDAILGREGDRLASWRSPAGTQVDAAEEWIAEGAIEWNRGPASPDRRAGRTLSHADLQEARGDFVLMALRSEGVLLASGVANGFRPIYVATLAAGTVVASTRMTALLPILGERTSFDVDALCAACTSLASPRPDATPYAAVRQVPMGRAWLVRAGTPPDSYSVERPFRETSLLSDAGGYADRLRSELLAAVRRATRGASRVALSVSGGVDSGTVLSLLAHERRANGGGPPFDAFAVTFDAPAAWDDRPYRQLLSDHWSVPIAEIDPAGMMLSQRAVRSHLVVDGLPCRAVGLPLAAEMARRADLKGSRIFVTGEGGDDVLNGQPGLYGDLLRTGHAIQAIRGVLGLRALPWRSLRRLRSLLQLRTALSPFEPAPLRRRRQRYGLLTAYPWAGPRLVRFVEQVLSEDRPRLSLDASAEERYRALRSMTVFNDLARGRGQEEVVGGHVRRDPFLDDEFLRFVATLPPLALLQGGYKRGLLRESMRGLLPEALRLRQTKSFIEPAFVRMTSGAGGVRAIEDLIDARMLADLGIVEPKRFRAHYEEVAAQPADRGWLYLWAFIAVEAFLRFHADPTPSRAPWN
jgi:asparagine synthase (glutamine-hydrolysing)